MDKDIKLFILGLVIFITGIIGSGLFIISNSITLAADQNNLIPITMFILMVASAIFGLVLAIKKIKK